MCIRDRAQLAVTGGALVAPTLSFQKTGTLTLAGGTLETGTGQIFTSALNADGDMKDPGAVKLSDSNWKFDSGVIAFDDAKYNIVSVSYTHLNVIQRLYANGYTSLQITAYSFFTATVMLAGFLPESIRQIESAPLSHVIAVIFLGVFPSALAYLLWAKALSFAATTSDVTKFMFLTPLLSFVLGYVVISELPGVETWIGGALILSGLALFHISGQRAERARRAAMRH